MVSYGLFTNYDVFDELSIEKGFWKQVSAALLKSRHQISYQTDNGNVFTDKLSTMKFIKLLVTASQLNEYKAA